MLTYKQILVKNWKKDILGGILGMLIFCPLFLAIFLGMFYLVMVPVLIFKSLNGL